MAKLKKVVFSKAGFVLGNGKGSTSDVLKRAKISRQVNKAFSGKRGNPNHSKKNGRFI